MSWTVATIPNLKGSETGYTDGTHYIAVLVQKLAGNPDKTLFVLHGVGRQVTAKGDPVKDSEGNPVTEETTRNAGVLTDFVGNDSKIKAEKETVIAQVQAEFDGLLNSSSVYDAL